MPSQYEVLIDAGNAGLVFSPDYSAVKRFEFKDGFYRQVLTGDADGVINLTWNLSKAFRDVSPAPQGLTAYRARYYGTNGLDGAYVSSDMPTGFPQSRINYIWNFIKRRMLYGDPAWFVLPVVRPQLATRPGYLFSVLPGKFDFSQDPQTALRQSVTIHLRQARGWLAPPLYGQVP